MGWRGAVRVVLSTRKREVCIRQVQQVREAQMTHSIEAIVKSVRAHRRKVNSRQPSAKEPQVFHAVDVQHSSSEQDLGVVEVVKLAAKVRQRRP